MHSRITESLGYRLSPLLLLYDVGSGYAGRDDGSGAERKEGRIPNRGGSSTVSNFLESSRQKKPKSKKRTRKKRPPLPGELSRLCVFINLIFCARVISFSLDSPLHLLSFALSLHLCAIFILHTFQTSFCLDLPAIWRSTLEFAAKFKVTYITNVTLVVYSFSRFSLVT